MWTLIRRLFLPMKTFRVDFWPSVRQLNVIDMGQAQPLFPYGCVYEVDVVDQPGRLDYMVFVHAVDVDHAISKSAVCMMRRVANVAPA